MSDENIIEIKLNKGKLVLMIIGSAVFIAAGAWLFFKTPETDFFLFRNPVVMKSAGMLSILFFGLCLIFIMRKWRDTRPGLIISEKGVTDNSSAITAGEIPWGDISEIKLITVFNTKFFMVIVKNPDEYINRQTNVFKKNTMKINYRNYGSPISISTNTLDCNSDELKNILDKKLNESRSKEKNNY